MFFTAREEWQRDAKCRGSSPALFFPDKGGNSHAESEAAKAVCNGHDGSPACPVRAECLSYALFAYEHWGVWGGMSERERRRLRKRHLAEPLDAQEDYPAAAVR